MADEDPRRTLERLRSSHDMLGGSAPRVDAAGGQEDDVERWARWTGRALAIVASIVIVAWVAVDFAARTP